MAETLTRVRRRFDVWNEVPLVPQLTGMSCWAAAAAMIVGWRDRVFVDPQEVANGSGTWEAYRAGLRPADVDTLARAWGLTMETRETWTVEALRRVLARFGPVWLGEASPGLHSIVVAGMHGDGTPDGTLVRVNDPWPVGKGERYTLPWRTLSANFRAASDLIGVQAHVLHAGGRRGSTRSRIEESRVTRTILPAQPTPEEAMTYNGNGRRPHHEEYDSAFGSPLAAAASVAAGERYLNTTAGGPNPLQGHGGTGENLYLAWNELPDDCGTIDIVVHLHGHSPSAPDAALTRAKVAESGMSLRSRTRATLAILPRGRKITAAEVEASRVADPEHPRSPNTYSFPALTARSGAGLEGLVSYALAWLAREVLRRPAPPGIGRVILTAHSGGGSSLEALLGSRAARRVCNPDEVHAFDALYGRTNHLRDWADARIRADQLLAPAVRATQGGGLRVVYREGTATRSREVSDALPAAGTPLHAAYRAEPTDDLSHGQIPRTCGPILLGDVTANLPLGTIDPPRTRRTSRGHGVEEYPLEVPAYAGYGYVEALTVDADVRSWLAAAPADRAPLAPAVAAWIADTQSSGIELIPDAARRRHFLSEVDWSRVDFPGNDENRSAESNALFNALAGPVPERRVPSIRYRDVDSLVRPVPDETRFSLYPEANEAYVRMRDAARADGVTIRISSAWRSLATQRGLAARNPNPNAVAQRVSAHCYGLAVDLRLSVPGLSVREATTRPMSNIIAMYRSPVYKWLALHAREFGWFPYRREPWHWEYNPVGFQARFEAAGRPAAGQAYGAPFGLLERYQSSTGLNAPAGVIPIVRDDGAFALQAAPPALDWCTLGQTIAGIADREERDWTQNGVKLEEDHPSRLAVLERYWGAVPGVNAADKARRSAAHDPLWPWSGAFICYVMHQAGVRRAHGFNFAAAHIHYIVGALRNRERSDTTKPFWLLDGIEIVNEVTVQPGDLLCMNRPHNGQMTTHSYETLRRSFWENGRENATPEGFSHCTLVVNVGQNASGRFAETVGGNELDSVRRNRYGQIPLNAAGGIANPAAHNIFGMIKNTGCRS